MLDAADRATTPLLATSTGGAAAGRLGRGAGRLSAACRDDPATHGPESVAFLSTGQIADRGDGAARRAGEVRHGLVHGDGNTRQCMATVGRRLQAIVWLRRAALHLRRLRGIGRASFSSGRTCASRHPILWERVCAIRIGRQIVVIDPRTHRNGDGRDAASAAAAEIGPGAVLRPREPADRSTAGSTEASSTRTRAASRSFAEFVAEFHARARRRRDGPGRGRDSSGWPRSIHEGKRVSFWWTMGVNQSYQGVRTAQASSTWR